jgi:ADP-heptose:LPS heptosyltransferase
LTGISTIAVLRALQLGDLLCAVPAWRALRAALPHARIALIGLPWAEAFVRRFGHYLDELIEFPGYPGLPERPPILEAIPSFLADLQRRRFDLVIQMHGSGRIVNQIVALCGARMTAGFFQPGEYCPDSSRFCPYPDGIPEVRRHLRLMECLGIPSRGEHLEFPLTHDDYESFGRLQDAASLVPGRYICVHPGGRGANRRWAPERFGRVADVLAAEGLGIVITGTSEEHDLIQAMRASMRAPVVNLAGLTDLGSLGVLLKGARLLVSNDTGVSHVAAALRVPSVIICTGSDPVRWGPLNRALHRVLVGASTSVSAVLDAARTAIERNEREPLSARLFAHSADARRFDSIVAPAGKGPVHVAERTI